MRKRASSSVYKMKFNSLFDRVTRRRRRARLSGNKHNLEFDRVTRKRARMSQNKGDPKSKDRISQLPDELLITILSLLSLKVAGATSILSRRWRNLWTYTRGMFFDSYTIPLLYQCADDPYEYLMVERMEYINWVNLVLKNHRSATIDSFRICFDLQRSSTSDINRWIKFAIQKQGRSGLKNFVRTLQNCFHQIQVLSLLIHSPEERIGFEFPKLHNVKQLSLEIGAWDDVCLLHFTSLVEACPFLDTFKLKLLWKSPANSQRKIRQAANFPHKHLRLVEICGYYGRASDAELALYFIENAVMLNTMVIYPREHIEEVPFSQFMLNIARNHAKQHIAPKVPAGVELVIL